MYSAGVRSPNHSNISCLRDIVACLKALKPAAVPHGHPRPRVNRSTLGRRQRKSRLAHLRRSAPTVSSRSLANSIADEDVRRRTRPVPSTPWTPPPSTSVLSLFPWATFAEPQGRHQTAHPARPAGNFPTFIRITPRPRIHDVNILDQLVARGRCLLHHGSRLPRLRPLVSAAPKRARSSSPAPRRTSPVGGLYSRPVDQTTDLRCDQTVMLTGPNSSRYYPDSCAASATRYRDRQTSGLPDQQLRPAGDNHRPTVPKPLADRVVLQMDQAAPAHQGLLRHQRECGENPDLDRRLRLPAGGHPEKTAQIEASLYTILQILSVTRSRKRP